MNPPPGAKEQQQQASRMRELRVEDALLYLDQVKVEFGDRPHIYNEFLDIMKTFKTQQIDTPGVIRRVSNLFQGNRRLVLGFNTFLPEGYKIELPADGNGPPVAVFRAPGSNVAHVLSGPMAGMPNIPMAQQRAEAAAAAAEAPVPGKFFPRPANPPAAARNPLPLANRRPGGGPLIPGAPHPPHQGPYDDAEGEGMVPQQQPVPPVPRPPVAARSPVPPMRPSPPSAKGGPPPPPMDHPPLAPQPPVAAAANGVGAPLEFDHAINYVTTIKRRFAAEPETYKKFLEILHTYQKEQRGIKEVLDEVSVLFADHPDLLKEFTYFLPDAVQAQAKAQLDLAAKASEARKRNQAKLAIMSQAQSMQAPPKSSARGDNDRLSIPFGATLPRSVEQEREIMASAEHGIVTFEPARPPRRNEPTIAQAAARLGRPQTIPRKPVVMRTPEAIFFERAKAHLNRKELVWERPSGTKRHTPHTEFIKCLHLYGTGVLDKDELFLLMRNLFTQGHAPKGAAGNNPIIAQDAANLLRDFEEILYSRGAYAEQRLMEIYRTKFGTMRTRDFDFTDCETPTPSYRAYPGSFPKERFWVHPEQSPEEAEILNRDFACVGDMERMTDSKDFFDGVRSRHNVYEEALCRVEDERYEVDMAIQRNAQAIKDIEPLAEECLRLGKREEDDGQPIGRLRYKLKPDSLHSIAIGAIGRAYGDRGDEVLQHLVQNPVIVLPIVYRRLKIKDAEWRKVKDDLTGRWDAATAANYEGSRDVRSYFDRKELERLFDASYLIDQCKKAKNFVKDPPKEMNPIADTVRPNFSIGIEDPGAIFYEATVSMPCKVDSLHRDAIQLVSRKLQAMPSLSALDRERIGRIIAEVVVPWFGYPAHWVMEEVRESFAGSAAPAVVKFSPGQRVVTVYGEGVVNQFIDAKQGYRIRLAYGVATLNPSAVFYHLPNKDAPYIRRDGVMVRDRDVKHKVDGDTTLGPKHQLLFATERIYLFVRYFASLCQLLTDVNEHCDTFPVSDTPASSYHDPKKQHVSNRPAERLDYSGVLASLKKLVSQRMSFKDFEGFGRLVSSEKVAVMAAIPKLLDLCTESLVSVAKEDALLHLYDYCQFRGVDPAIVRDQCFTMAPDAYIRIQYDQSTLYFSYLPKSVEFPRAPRSQDLEIEEFDESERADESMEEDPEDPIQEYQEERPVKRVKLR